MIRLRMRWPRSTTATLRRCGRSSTRLRNDGLGGYAPLPLSTYSAQGGLRQDPGDAPKWLAEARTCGNGVAKMRVLLSTWGSRGDVEPLLGLAVALRALGAEVRMCAPPDFAEHAARVGVPM